ncbi:MAG: DUF427 domain-containing protein [Sneathiella sp.]|nr:DUF427 domain-containing protein [Sneathiella sp.]
MNTNNLNVRNDPAAPRHEGYRLSLMSEPRRIRAKFHGQTIADSGDVLVMHETGFDPVFYFPRDDVSMRHLVKNAHYTHCPFKGNASYWTIRAGKYSTPDAAWSYETAYDETSGVKDYIAFKWSAIDQWSADDLDLKDQPLGKTSVKENPLITWLLQDASLANSTLELVASFSEALMAAGLPLWRFRLLNRTMNPLLFALVYTWQRDDDEVTVYEVSHEVLEGEQYRNSPFALVIKGEGGIRRRLEGPNAQLDFPILEDLVSEGATDYLAMPITFSDGQINILTLVSDQPGGFSAEEIVQIYEIMPTLSRLFEAHALRLSSSTLLQTYLGADAGQRVMKGQVKRGDGENIHAALWMTDLRDSTSLAAFLSREEYLALLNKYFDCVAEAVLEHGGEVLKFIGDSVLAIFAIDDPDQENPEACTRALAAADAASKKVEAVNKEHAAAGLPLLKFGIGLHRGDLTYGNIGTAKRLDFTVIGSAVNEVARIESLSKTLHRQILSSSTFRKSVSDPMVSLGEHSLRGVSGDHEIFGLLKTENP